METKSARVDAAGRGGGSLCPLPILIGLFIFIIIIRIERVMHSGTPEGHCDE